MSIKTDPVANFWAAIRALNFQQTLEVAGEISEELESVSPLLMAMALSSAAENKPDVRVATRGGDAMDRAIAIAKGEA